MSKKPRAKSATPLIPIEPEALPAPTDPAPPIFTVRGEAVMLDRDVAALFGVETRALNQQFTRNVDSFAGFAFRVTEAELADLRSQNVISRSEWGGSRFLPVVFTEHGVVMAATMLKSARAIEATRRVIRAFVDGRSARQADASPGVLTGEVLPPAHRVAQMTRVRDVLGQVIDAMTNPKAVKKATAEADGVFAESVKSLKAYVSKPGLDNDLKRAEVRKLIAEAESIEVDNAGKRLKNEELRLALLMKKLLIVQQAQQSAHTDFGQLLEELGLKPITDSTSQD